MNQPNGFLGCNTIVSCFFDMTHGKAHARGRLTGLNEMKPPPFGRAWAGSHAISLRYAATARDLGE